MQPLDVSAQGVELAILLGKSVDDLGLGVLLQLFIGLEKEDLLVARIAQRGCERARALRRKGTARYDASAGRRAQHCGYRLASRLRDG